MLTELVRDRTLHNNIWRNVQVGEHTGSLHCLLPRALMLTELVRDRHYTIIYGAMYKLENTQVLFIACCPEH